MPNKTAVFFLFLFPLAAAAQELSVSTKPIYIASEDNIRSEDFVVTAPVKGTPSAYETFDITAPFDGRIDEVIAELFDKVEPKTLLSKMVAKDMGAILDTANNADPESKREILKRWKGTFEYYEIRPEEGGIVCGIYVKPKMSVTKGERLFTIARKMQMIVVNSEPIYSDLSKGLKAQMHYVRDGSVKVNLTLKDFIPFRDRPNYYRLWLEFDELREKAKVGSIFEGTLFIGEKKDARIVDKKNVLTYGGKRYLIMGIQTGLISQDKVEILSPSRNYLKPKTTEDKNGRK